MAKYICNNYISQLQQSSACLRNLSKVKRAVTHSVHAIHFPSPTDLFHDTSYRFIVLLHDKGKLNIVDNRTTTVLSPDDVKCNASEDHNVLEGTSITYSCTFKYQGFFEYRMVDWVGIGIRRSIKEHLTRVAVPTAEVGTSYEGEYCRTNSTFHNSLSHIPCPRHW